MEDREERGDCLIFDGAACQLHPSTSKAREFAALSVAMGLLGAFFPRTGARIVALIGGPCSEGPGTIVSKDLSEPLRSLKYLDKDAAPFYKKANKFYDGLANQLVNQGHVLDLFASALDQVQIRTNRSLCFVTCPKCRHCPAETCQKILDDGDFSQADQVAATPTEIVVVTIAPLEPGGRVNTFRESS